MRADHRVVALHQRRGHDVTALGDLRRLDLEQADAVRGRRAALYYPAAAALSGAGAGLVISGGELVTAVSAGTSAAPSGVVIAGAFVADAATVLALASRSVGHVSLFWRCPGSDPGPDRHHGRERPGVEVLRDGAAGRGGGRVRAGDGQFGGG